MVTITFTGWGGTEEDEGVQAAIEQFESEQDAIKVTWLHTPENYQEKLLTDIAAGTPPDTAFIGSDIYREFIRDGLLLDITDKLKADPLIGAPDYFIEPQEEALHRRMASGMASAPAGSRPISTTMQTSLRKQASSRPATIRSRPGPGIISSKSPQALTVDVNGKHPNDDGFDPENIDRYGIDWPNTGGFHPLR